jgi:hypothetical protein
MSTAPQAQRLLLFLLLPILTLSAPADEQGWINNSLSLKIAPVISLKFTQETRFNELTLTDAYLGNWSGGVAWSISSNFYASFAYLRETTLKSTARLQENRYTLEAGWKTAFSKSLSFDLRFRSEIRNFEEELAPDHLRFRLRTRLVITCKRGEFTFKPFLAVEPFANVTEGEINSNRVYAGVTFPLSKQMEWTVNYIRQDSTGKDPVHIFNTGFDLKF